MTELKVSVSNVGGIDELECTFDDPVTAVTGPNASNKTSLLQAIAFGLGRSTVPIKNDAEETRVELEIDDQQVVRKARATPNGPEIIGDGLLSSLDDVELLERFACLFEFNDLRQAVRGNGDFEAALKAPMNLDELERERSEKLERKRRLKTDLEQLQDVDTELSAKRESLTEAEQRVETLEANLEELRERQAETTTEDDALSTLREERADIVRRRNQYENQVADLEEAIARLDERIAELDDSLEAALQETASHDVEALRAEREEIEHEIEAVEERYEVLQSVLMSNREMLHSAHTGALGQDTSLVEDSYVCWACGDDASESDFEETLEKLQEVIEQDESRRREHEPRLREIEEWIEAAEQAEQRIATLEADQRDLEERREHRTNSLATKREQLSAVRDELAQLDEELTAHEADRESEASDLTDETEQVQNELHTARREATRLRSDIEDLEADREERRRKQDELETLSEEITELTARIENLETHLRDGFNEAMDDLLSILAYENINRMWLDGNFDVVVAREIDGVTRRDTIDHLSESEREMVGLVLAIAGYLAYDVSDIVPVLLIDTLGAFDADRTADLLAYVSEDVSLVISSVLLESADAVEQLDAETGVVYPTDPAVFQ